MTSVQWYGPNFGLRDSKSPYFSFKTKIRDISRYLEDFSRYLEIFWGYLDIFLRISGKIFRRFYVIFVSRPNLRLIWDCFRIHFHCRFKRKSWAYLQLLYCLKQWQERITLVMDSWQWLYPYLRKSLLILFKRLRLLPGHFTISSDKFYHFSTK